MMDYLFMIELNDQKSDLPQLKREIRLLGEHILYLEMDEQEKGLLGIVRSPRTSVDTQVQKATSTEDATEDDPHLSSPFFDGVRALVAKINNLDETKVNAGTLKGGARPGGDLPKGNPAKWARASVSQLLVGFDAQGDPDLNQDVNKYKIDPVLIGGIGGKHSLLI